MKVTLYRNSDMPNKRITLQQLQTMIQHAYKREKQVANRVTPHKMYIRTEKYRSIDRQCRRCMCTCVAGF